MERIIKSKFLKILRILSLIFNSFWEVVAMSSSLIMFFPPSLFSSFLSKSTDQMELAETVLAQSFERSEKGTM